MKNAKYLKQQKQEERKTQDFKDNLRKKFTDQCKKYFGVPYHQKYWSEGEEYHNAPLYLDCCGLIRQVVYDLREDFGFSLGRWNQAYQFDVCPQEIEYKDMKPGDLVFISATYYNQRVKTQPIFKKFLNKNKKLKPFAHNMVHVEVFTGGETGEQTIGARYQKGVIQYHDSYKFISKNYYDMKYHFRSLDTWLDGICKSQCAQHEWRDDRDLWIPDKYSVFASPELQESEAIEEKQIENDFQIKKIYIGSGNNSQIIENFFKDKNTENKNRQYQLMDKQKTFNPFFYFKWVQTKSEVDFLSFNEGQQIINHIANVTIFTTKVGLLNLLRDYQSIQQETIDFFPETYQLDLLSDEILFLNKKLEKEQKQIWILKPHNNNMGKGIQIIEDIYIFKQNFIQQKNINQDPILLILLLMKLMKLLIIKKVSKIQK
ncbi:tubulin-tyrosine ligase family protein, putative [Ichthyophthirius multifiliis]|uniref:Tubulin-tyrosine ligase family protein, putative n=1 Tax=Ichthyophthirius multifiliis TaxID=5932 RepID=G0QTA5_ICHMU|nr:tubulin-tyrosine ligase family protein, putative [Ichthyophthirius multifiliis]EGR31540.1 tubulin-tyrosine ligase family protein, putative [Ichthyophthirius multifiliis]|eukprot:XP_004035026.1 tubulin-tyrosine ligase family protein, putative [Ichthyophthirius multifiliis]